MSPAPGLRASLYEGERRVVTVLFADVKGFTAMSERLDPEDVREIMNDCFSRLSEAVYAQQGLVDKYVGDALMALFGVPRAAEDDAARAVEAALAMQDALRAFSTELEKTRGFALSMRIGINTGLVVAGDVGSKQKKDFTVMGDAVNTASRIESAAEPGAVWISEATRRFVGARFSLKALKPVAVKGKAKPLALFEVLGPAESGAERAPTVCVGRERELALIVQTLAEAREGACGVVALIGDAGLGKTTLVNRFLEDACCGEPPAQMLRASSPPRGAEPFSLFVELAQRAPGAPALPGAEQQGWRERYFLEWERWLLTEASRRPLVLTLEDLHFSDSGSWELTGFLANRLRRAKLMLLATMRPSPERSPAWHAAETFLPISLRPFPKREAVAAIDGMLGENELPAAFKERLAAKAEGHPYFLSEILWKLADSGRIERNGGGWHLSSEGNARQAVPETIQAALSARLDGLPEDERETALMASVLGLRVHPELLAALDAREGLSARLESLVDKRFFSRAISPDGDELFEFTHALLQEACYGSLLRPKREAAHRRAASALENACSGYDSAWEGIADHHERAGGGPKALAAHWEAGRRAAARSAVDLGLSHLDRCLALLESGVQAAGVERARVLFEAGGLHILAFSLDRALRVFRECATLLPMTDPMRVQAIRTMAGLFNIQGHPELSLEALEVAATCDCKDLPKRERLKLFYALAGRRLRADDEIGARAWLDRLVAEAAGSGLEFSPPDTDDIHELLPAYSEVTAPASG